MGRLGPIGALATGALALTMLGGCGGPPRWQSQLLSTNATGTDSANGQSWQAESFSADGNLVAFVSSASNLVPTDTNGDADVYVRNLTTGTTTLVSVNAAGTDSGNGGSANPVISPDGTKVVFQSTASNLGPADSGSLRDVYVRDLASGTTSMVSVNAAGTGGGNGDSLFYGSQALSPDGSKVAFVSDATNLGAPDHNGVSDVYQRDLVGGTTTLVSVNAAGTDTGNGEASGAAFDATGNRIFFTSIASNLGPYDHNGFEDVYFRDLTTATTTLVTINGAGTNSGNGSSTSPIPGPDNLVAFYSSATDLGPEDDDGIYSDVYLRDLSTGATTLLSNQTYEFPSGVVFSPDGSKIAWTATVSASGGTGFVRDLASGQTRSFPGMAQPSFDSTSTMIAYTGTDTAPEPGACYTAGPFGGPRQCTEVYVRNLVDGTNTLVSSTAADASKGGTGDSGRARFRPGTSQILFSSTASDLAATDTNQAWDLFLATYTAPPSG